MNNQGINRTEILIHEKRKKRGSCDTGKHVIGNLIVYLFLDHHD